MFKNKFLYNISKLKNKDKEDKKYENKLNPFVLLATNLNFNHIGLANWELVSFEI
jgi:hypothetical protein